MKNNPSLKGLEAQLGYSFLDISLLDKALSHRSLGKDNNERLEFLGDSLLNFFIAEAMYQRFDSVSEGDLSRLRAQLVRGETLAKVAEGFGLGEHLRLGGGELKSGGHRRKSIQADAVEAIIGAIYLDSDMEQCRSCVLEWFDHLIHSIKVEDTKDAKTRLQESRQARGKSLPKYKLVDSTGANHERSFKVECSIGEDFEPCVAEASSKRQAEKLAAKCMLEKIEAARAADVKDKLEPGGEPIYD